MLKTVIIAQDPTDPASWTEAEVPNIHEYIRSQIQLTDSTKMYHGSVDAMHEVTPWNEAGIDALDALPGPFYVIMYPEWAAVPYIIAAIALILSVVAMNSIPKPVTTDNNTPSPNNALTSRQNIARPFKRIEDIYGTVRSVPSLLMVPYSEYINNIEYEHSYMCIGRGRFVIQDCLDDATPISTIDGAGVTIYGPGDSPNRPGPSLPLPGFQVFGLPTVGQVCEVYHSTAVNGQDLLTDNEDESVGTSDTMAFSMDLSTGRGTIVFSGREDLSAITAGSSVYLYAKGYKTHHTTHDIFISGTYVVYSCDSTTLVLKDVQSVALDWGWVAWSGEYNFTESHIVQTIKLAVGPFLLGDPDQDSVWMNIIATSGMYQIDSDGNVSTVDATILATIQPCDVDGSPTADPYQETLDFVGDASKGTVAVTWKIALASPGPCTLTLYRSTTSPINSQVVDGIKWKDLLSRTPISEYEFGDVTTCYSVTKATEGALSVKERKLNMLVTRMLPVRQPDNTFLTTVIAPTNFAADILCAMALDPQVGGRNPDELDVAQIYDTVNSVVTYFGDAGFGEFCYTFDDDNTSFEEMVAAAASTVFCTAYRQGHQMRMHFERQTDDSSLLFGHRNILPGSQQRTVSFGNQNDYDSVEYDYIHPTDDSQVTLYIPAQGNNAQKLTSTGVRNYPQAYAQAWRIWNKILYTNTQADFKATQEASMLLLNDRVLISDTTRSNGMDGEIVAQNVLELQLSQPYTFISGKSYTIFLQGVEGSVESIPITRGYDQYNVLLPYAPSVTLNLDDNASARTIYWIVPNDDVRPQAFLITSRTPDDGFTEKVSAVNYDDRYYSKDQAFKLGTIPTDPD